MRAAGDAITVSVLRNGYAEKMVHQALPQAKIDQYESVDLAYQALDSGRADAVSTEISSLRWFMLKNRSFMTLEFYALCGLLYFAINFGIERLGARLHSRLAWRA